MGDFIGFVFVLIALLSSVAWVVGLIAPANFARKGNVPTRLKITIICWAISLANIVLAGVFLSAQIANNTEIAAELKIKTTQPLATQKSTPEASGFVLFLFVISLAWTISPIFVYVFWKRLKEARKAHEATLFALTALRKTIAETNPQTFIDASEKVIVEAKTPRLENKELIFKPAKIAKQEKPSKTKDVLRFMYRDENGVESTREVKSFSESAYYFEGICADKKELRTFRKDRVIIYLDDSEKLLSTPFAAKPVAIKPAFVEVLFTGIAADKRSKLEALAQKNGMHVVKNVTQNLTYLCVGARAGASKPAQARENGATILTDDQFMALIETGELPIEND